MSNDWIVCAPEASVESWLESNGLSKYASKIIEVTDAETLDDLKLLDADLVQQVIRSADLKVVTAKKFQLAIAQLRGETSPSKKSRSEPQLDFQPADRTCEQSSSPELQTLSQVKECIAICIDRSGSMGSPLHEITLNVVKGETRDSVAERTRMEAVKAMFYAFRDRVESLGPGGHQLGLLQFDNVVEQLLDLTPELDRFECIVDDMAKRGQTAIYSAIVQAAHMLEKKFQEDSNIDLRVLVLTDGQNNTGVQPVEALGAVNKIGAVVDAIIVGDNPDANLRKIVSATGGECYQVNNLGEGFELLEAEGVVSLHARRGGVDKPPFELRPMADFDSLSEKTITKGGAVQRAPALAPDFAKKVVVSVDSIKDATISNSNISSASVKRILTELKQVSSGEDRVWMHSGDGIHIFPAPDSINFWRVLLEGPDDSPFQDGVFALTVILPNEYPFRPPQVTFETPVYHCNVSDSGKICLDLLQDNWNPALTTPKCLEAIRMMLKKPDTDNSLRQWIAELTLAHQKSNGADTRYYDKARENTHQEAAVTVEAWKQKWSC